MRLIIINIFVFCLSMTLVSSVNSDNNHMAQMFNNDHQLPKLSVIRRMQRSNLATRQKRDTDSSDGDTNPNGGDTNPNGGAILDGIANLNVDAILDGIANLNVDAILVGIANTKSTNALAGSRTVPINYHGGPVIQNPVIYLIWYGNWAGNTAIQIITNFVQNLGTTPWWNINRAYTSTGHSNTAPIIYGGSTSDNYSQGTNLTQASIWAIVQKAINSAALPNNTNGVYFVLTSNDVRETSFCTQACGWHTYNGAIKYAWVGNPATQCPTACADQTVSPNGNLGADAMVSVIAHESAESVSDPNLNAWYDSQGNENADKCAWTFGSETRLSNGAYYNIVVNGVKYLIQQLWKYPAQTCGMS